MLCFVMLCTGEDYPLRQGLALGGRQVPREQQGRLQSARRRREYSQLGESRVIQGCGCFESTRGARFVLTAVALSPV